MTLVCQLIHGTASAVEGAADGVAVAGGQDSCDDFGST